MKTTIILIAIAALAGPALAADVVRTRDAQSVGAPVQIRPTPASLRQQLAAVAERLELSAKDRYWNRKYDDAVTFYHLLIKAGRAEYDDLYNLACCYARLGKVAPAAKYLGMSVQGGFTDVRHIIADPDFEGIRDTPAFKAVVDGLIADQARAAVDGSPRQ
ncbi:MAG: hypothetical protein MUF78_05210 [Candidatus Edwardsbacteria bacterium]|jgi:hypothetical protein|nr:hypothetical protein [Candidatus Edwardsbacteria bacterium]